MLGSLRLLDPELNNTVDGLCSFMIKDDPIAKEGEVYYLWSRHIATHLQSKAQKMTQRARIPCMKQTPKWVALFIALLHDSIETQQHNTTDVPHCDTSEYTYSRVLNYIFFAFVPLIASWSLIFVNAQYIYHNGIEDADYVMINLSLWTYGVNVVTLQASLGLHNWSALSPLLTILSCTQAFSLLSMCVLLLMYRHISQTVTCYISTALALFGLFYISIICIIIER